MEVTTETFQEKTRTAQSAVEDTQNSIPKRPLTSKEMERLADMVMSLSQQMAGVELYPYEYEFGWRIIYSLLIEDADEVTALFARQSGKCLARGTPILMYDGRSKAAEEIVVGDLLMGDDSTPRTVLSTCFGNERMWEVRPNSKGHEPYTVNESHILTGVSRHDGRVVDRSVKSLLKLKSIESSFLGYKAKISFPYKEVPADPYWLGLWLGDGSSPDVGITTADHEVVDYLRDIGLKGNKRIPLEYKANSEDVRLKVLAGIIDSDGHRPTAEGKESTCEVTFKLRGLSEDLQWLCRSLGFRASLEEREIKGRPYWRAHIYGELWRIPTRIERKKYPQNTLRENPQTYGFTLVDKGIGDYYGFEIDGNKRFLLGDCTVTHNTETVAVVVCGMMVMLPLLGNVLGENEERLAKFKNGLWVGIYGPTYEQAGIMWSRMKLRMYSKESKKMLLDPEINIDITGQTENMSLPNGSFCDCGTASPQASIEGKTYHLILLEETQDILSSKIRASIHPMAAATAGTLVKIGTCNRKKSEFYEACRRNKRSDVKDGLVRSRLRLHFEFDYTVAQRYNKRYRKYVTKERDRLGEDSDDFKMKYRLHWLLERGMFVNPDLLDECGIKDTKNKITIVKGKGRRKRNIEFLRPANVVTFDPKTPGLVAAIDVGRENSTVVTVGKPFWDGPTFHGEDVRYPLHVYNWLELYGDDHEAQHPQIIDFLKNYKISQAIVDATGKGDPVYSRIAAELDVYGIEVIPFLFSAESKDVGYKVLLQEIQTRRFSFPAGNQATRLQKWQRFVNQMYDLEKSWRGQRMVVSKPKDERDARDDFPDSLMMLNWLVNIEGTLEVETAPNPFLGRSARWMAADMMKDTRSWFKAKMEPKRLPGYSRPSKRGKWD